jgi:hypothetical protein
MAPVAHVPQATIVLALREQAGTNSVLAAQFARVLAFAAALSARSADCASAVCVYAARLMYTITQPSTVVVLP